MAAYSCDGTRIDPPKRIVVTGSRGQLGSLLVTGWGDRAVGVDRRQLDLTCQRGVKEFLQTHRPDVVVNCAAFTAVDLAEQQPEACHAVNVAAVETLAKLTAQLGAQFVQVSTDYVFTARRSPPRPWTETSPLCPLGAYATSKAQGESMAAGNPSHLIIRTCGLYRAPVGDRSFPNFVATMLRVGRQRSEVDVVDDQRCTPSWAPQVARGIRHLVDTRQQGTFHVVNAGDTTWAQFAKELFALARIPCRVRTITTEQYRQQHPQTAPRPAYSVLSCDKYLSAGGPHLDHWRTALAKALRDWA